MSNFFYYFEAYLRNEQLVVGNNIVKKFNKMGRSELCCNI